jgi:UDP-glucose:(heptosyl)LPS alpha-1,3-glucosyltransferase
MKIAIQIEHFDPRRGGAETYTHQLARMLLEHGQEVHVISRSWCNPPDGVKLHGVPAPGWTAWRRIASYSRDADRIAAGLNPDVILSMGKTAAADVLQPHGGTVRCSQKQNVARIAVPWLAFFKAVFQRVNPKHRAARRQESLQYRRRPLPHVVAVSGMVAQDMRHFFHVPEDRLHIIHNGVDTRRFHPGRLAPLRQASRDRWHIPADRLVFALVAHNFKLKGVAQLIAAASLLESAGCDFTVVIAGKGKPDRYRSQAVKLGCSSRVIFTGPVAQIEELYAMADVYVHPTWYDPCSLVVLEALASGLPVITTRCNGAAELITPGREGFVMETPRDAAELARLMELFFDPGRLRLMKQQAGLLGAQHDWERHFEQMIRVLKTAASERKRRHDG